MKSRYYILDKNGLPKAVDLFTWDKWLTSNPDRDVKRTVINSKIQVITVFFCLPETDIRMEDEECVEFMWFYGTMVFGGGMDHHEEKYVTREEAEDGHERLVARVKAIREGRVGPPQCCKKSNYPPEDKT